MVIKNSYKRFIILSLFIIIILSNSILVGAIKNLVFDEAGLFTSDERASLETEEIGRAHV